MKRKTKERKPPPTVNLLLAASLPTVTYLQVQCFYSLVRDGFFKGHKKKQTLLENFFFAAQAAGLIK